MVQSGFGIRVDAGFDAQMTPELQRTLSTEISESFSSISARARSRTAATSLSAASARARHSAACSLPALLACSRLARSVSSSACAIVWGCS